MISPENRPLLANPSAHGPSQHGARTAAACLPEFKDRQAEFAKALLDPESPVPAGLLGPDRQPSAKRFAVYRNNVVIGWIEALKAAFPVVHRLVGGAYFTAMARIYALRNPPSSPVMLDYGSGFPSFIAAFEPAAALPYLADVARLERFWVESYHACEGRPIAWAALGQWPEASRPYCRLLIHPSVRLLRASHPVFDIWRANIDGDGCVNLSAEDRKVDLLIARPAAEVEVRCLPPGTAAFIGSLLDGKSILDALRNGLANDLQFDPERALPGLFEIDMVVGVAQWPCTDQGVDPGAQAPVHRSRSRAP